MGRAHCGAKVPSGSRAAETIDGVSCRGRFYGSLHNFHRVVNPSFMQVHLLPQKLVKASMEIAEGSRESFIYLVRSKSTLTSTRVVFTSIYFQW